jgi:hypothetical protein
MLLILWSGCHADVPKEYFPPKGILPDLPAGGTFMLSQFSFLQSHIIVKE